MNPFLVELIVVRAGSRTPTDQRSLVRDVERGLLVRLRRGVYVVRAVWESMSPEEQRVLRLRAAGAASDAPLHFSHWSAAVALQKPILERRRLVTGHVSALRADRRTLQGITVHEFGVREEELVRVGDLLVTSPARTVIDIAGAAPFREAVATADGVLHAKVPRRVLLEAVDLAGPRRAARRIADVLGFAHPFAESVAESGSRCGFLELGIAPPELQHRFFDRLGFVARSDFWDPVRRIAGEADGMKKFLDPKLAKEGAGKAVWDEKRREDRLLACADRVARWGYPESMSAHLLGLTLAAHGWLAAAPRATLRDYIAAAAPFG